MLTISQADTNGINGFVDLLAEGRLSLPLVWPARPTPPLKSPILYTVLYCQISKYDLWRGEQWSIYSWPGLLIGAIL